MDNIPSYFLNSNSYWEWFKGSIMILPEVFIKYIWIIPFIVIISYCIGNVKSRALLGKDVKLSFKEHIKIFRVIIIAYLFLIIVLMGPLEASIKQEKELNEFKEQLIKNGNYELLDKLLEIRKQNNN